MSSEALKLTLAAAVATAVTSLVFVSAFGPGAPRRRVGETWGQQGEQHFDVPPEILVGDCECKEVVILAVRLALEGE